MGTHLIDGHFNTGKMNSNPNTSRTTSQIVYTSVDDDMTVTEIICEYGDYDDAVTEAVCEVEAPDLSQGHIFIEDSSSSSYTPVVKEEKIYVDCGVVAADHINKEEKIYIEDATGAAAHQIFNEDKKFKCGVCCEQFDDLPTISRHMEDHSGEKKYECAECGKQFKNINNVMRHMVVHSGERQYMCPVCRKPFTQVGNLKRHMFVHSGEKKFPCNACGKAFTQMNNLIRHQAIHSGQKNFECQICHRLFNQASNLNRHILIHKGIKLFKCDICSRSFSQLTNLQKHKERHERGKKYNCNVCEEGFDHKLIFNKHLETHFGKPRFQCNVCGRVVTQKSTLNQHMLLHIESKKYFCERCNKSYAQKGSLAKHMEAHNNVKHHCKVCNRYFYDESGLLKHEAMHTDKAKSIAGFVEQEIKLPDYDHQFCELCGKSFILKRSLRKHLANRHEVFMEVKRKPSVKENLCQICGKVFVHRKSLKKHCLKKHGVRIEFEGGIAKQVVKIEKENEITEPTKKTDASGSTTFSILDEAKIAETLLQIKQENVIEADTSPEESECVWKEITSDKVKVEPGVNDVGATVHVCKICERGYYLINNLRKHMSSKHGVMSEKEGENSESNEDDNDTSIQMVNEYLLKEANSVGKGSKEVLSITINEENATSKPVQMEEKAKVINAKDSDAKGVGRRKKKLKTGPKSGVPVCELCEEGFASPVDLLLHMLQHSKEKKNALLNVVNEAAQDFQNFKESEAELSVTEKTKGLVSHFRKCSRNQSDEIASVFSISEKYQENPSIRAGFSRYDAINLEYSEEESIISECLEVGLEVKQEVIEINEFEDDYILKLDL